MKENRGIVFFIAFLLAGTLSSYSFGQGANPGAAAGGGAPPANQPPQALKVGVIDIAAVMSAHPILAADAKNFENEENNLKMEVNRIGKELEEKRKAILLAYKPGTAEFIEANDKLAKEQVDAEVEIKKQMRALQLKVLKAEYNAYLTAKEEIERVAVALAFLVIIQNQTIESNPDDLNTAVAEMSKPIIWSSPKADITNIVINQLNKRFASASTPVVCQIDAQGKRTFLNDADKNITNVASPGAPRPGSPAGVQPRTATPGGAPPRN
ncbi:MAG: OmpH family outer membrane protein [Thermoguttaceae bacterium]